MPTATPSSTDTIRRQLTASRSRRRRRPDWLRPATFGRPTAIEAIITAEPLYQGAHYLPIAITRDKTIVMGEGIVGTMRERDAQRAAQALAAQHLGAIPGYICHGDVKLYAYRVDGDERRTVATMWSSDAYEQRLARRRDHIASRSAA